MEHRPSGLNFLVSIRRVSKVWFGEIQLTDVYLTPGKVGSAVVPNSAFEKPCEVTVCVYVLAKPTGTKVELGTFEVLPLTAD
jgi:hypothetical protein